MANEEHLKRLKDKGVAGWNSWRKKAPDIRPDLSQAKFPKKPLSEVDFSQADLSGVDLSGIDILEGTLSEATLPEADFRGANLWRANFIGADLRGADFRDANLYGIKLLNADLAGADLRGANVASAEDDTFRGATYDDRTKWPSEEFDPASYGAVLTSEAETTPATLRDLAETFTVYVGIPALLLYPLGLFMLALQLYRHYDLKFLTAWYASSLVPNAVVAGHGAKAFLMPLFISLVVCLLVAKVTFRLRGGWKSEGRLSPDSPWARIRALVKAAPRVIIGIALLIVSVVIVLFVIAYSSDYGNLFAIPTAILVSFVGGFFIYLNHQSSEYKAMKLSKGVAEGWILSGLAIAYAGGLAGAFATVYVQGDTLPRVTIEHNASSDEYPPLITGLLLSHSEGYWFVLTTPNESSNVNEQNTAIHVEKYRYVANITCFAEDKCFRSSEEERTESTNRERTTSREETTATSEGGATTEPNAETTSDTLNSPEEERTESTNREHTMPREETTAPECGTTTEPNGGTTSGSSNGNGSGKDTGNPVKSILAKRTDKEIVVLPDDAVISVIVTR